MYVRLAERSKAPDLSSGSRMRAWVRTPHLTKCFFKFSKKCRILIGKNSNILSPFLIDFDYKAAVRM